MEQKQTPCTCDDLALHIFGTTALCPPCREAYYSLVAAEYSAAAIEANRAARTQEEISHGR